MVLIEVGGPPERVNVAGVLLIGFSNGPADQASVVSDACLHDIASGGHRSVSISSSP